MIIFSGHAHKGGSQVLTNFGTPKEAAGIMTIKDITWEAAPFKPSITFKYVWDLNKKNIDEVRMYAQSKIVVESNVQFVSELERLFEENHELLGKFFDSYPQVHYEEVAVNDNENGYDLVQRTALTLPPGMFIATDYSHFFKQMGFKESDVTAMSTAEFTSGNRRQRVSYFNVEERQDTFPLVDASRLSVLKPVSVVHPLPNEAVEASTSAANETMEASTSSTNETPAMSTSAEKPDFWSTVNVKYGLCNRTQKLKEFYNPYTEAGKVLRPLVPGRREVTVYFGRVGPLSDTDEVGFVPELDPNNILDCTLGLKAYMAKRINTVLPFKSNWFKIDKQNVNKIAFTRSSNVPVDLEIILSAETARFLRMPQEIRLAKKKLKQLSGPWNKIKPFDFGRVTYVTSGTHAPITESYLEEIGSCPILGMIKNNGKYGLQVPFAVKNGQRQTMTFSLRDSSFKVVSFPNTNSRPKKTKSQTNDDPTTKKKKKKKKKKKEPKVESEDDDEASDSDEPEPDVSFVLQRKAKPLLDHSDGEGDGQEDEEPTGEEEEQGEDEEDDDDSNEDPDYKSNDKDDSSSSSSSEDENDPEPDVKDTAGSDEQDGDEEQEKEDPDKEEDKTDDEQSDNQPAGDDESDSGSDVSEDPDNYRQTKETRTQAEILLDNAKKQEASVNEKESEETAVVSEEENEAEEDEPVTEAEKASLQLPSTSATEDDSQTFKVPGKVKKRKGPEPEIKPTCDKNKSEVEGSQPIKKTKKQKDDESTTDKKNKADGKAEKKDKSASDSEKKDDPETKGKSESNVKEGEEEPKKQPKRRSGQKKEPLPKFCTSCGNKFGGGKFCGFCGAKQKVAAVQRKRKSPQAAEGEAILPEGQQVDSGTVDPNKGEAPKSKKPRAEETKVTDTAAKKSNDSSKNVKKNDDAAKNGKRNDDASKSDKKSDDDAKSKKAKKNKPPTVNGLPNGSHSTEVAA